MEVGGLLGGRFSSSLKIGISQSTSSEKVKYTFISCKIYIPYCFIIAWTMDMVLIFVVVLSPQHIKHNQLGIFPKQ